MIDYSNKEIIKSLEEIAQELHTLNITLIDLMIYGRFGVDDYYRQRRAEEGIKGK